MPTPAPAPRAGAGNRPQYAAAAPGFGPAADERSYWPLLSWLLLGVPERRTTGSAAHLGRGSIPYFGPSAYYFRGPAFQLDFEKQGPRATGIIEAPLEPRLVPGLRPRRRRHLVGDYLWDLHDGHSVNKRLADLLTADGTPPYLLVKPNPH